MCGILSALGKVSVLWHLYVFLGVYLFSIFVKKCLMGFNCEKYIQTLHVWITSMSLTWDSQIVLSMNNSPCQFVFHFPSVFFLLLPRIFKCHDLFLLNNDIGMLSQYHGKWEQGIHRYLWSFPRFAVVWLHLYGMNGHETVMKNGGKEDG